MYNFGLEITSVFCGTVCPELLAQYHRNIHYEIKKIHTKQRVAKR